MSYFFCGFWSDTCIDTLHILDSNIHSLFLSYIHNTLRNMEKNEIKDRLFDVLNDTDNLPIQDIAVDDRNDMVNVYLTDGTRRFM